MGLLDLIFRPKKRSLRQAYEEDAATIEAFVDGRGGKWDRDNYISIQKEDSFLESVQLRCASASDDYPTEQKGQYCSDEGIQILRSMAAEMLAKIPSLPHEE